MPRKIQVDLHLRVDELHKKFDKHITIIYIIKAIIVLLNLIMIYMIIKNGGRFTW